MATRAPPAFASSALPPISARSTAPAALGSTPILLSIGNRLRQRGQKPETGAVTRPQSRHLTGRRARAIGQALHQPCAGSFGGPYPFGVIPYPVLTAFRRASRAIQGAFP